MSLNSEFARLKIIKNRPYFNDSDEPFIEVDYQAVFDYIDSECKIEDKYNRESQAKLKAMKEQDPYCTSSCQNYETFRQKVAANHLNPYNNRETSEDKKVNSPSYEACTNLKNGSLDFFLKYLRANNSNV